ncbi:hypothetical protein BC939DRAFT_479883 [Gamsiella multidivaricata]|uniref:uncharacterized protein n=1 Tax=Gamsiella multidivaricata TaxID=101098 RepID=UPI00222064AE|nr:uncharacterized protein BC939DRAFT_479883 [Gamsiella multidivaricata]KAI7819076.1 hypothetical protein BC939DRAFT_479883 [Gamsiella multidivaricata]
MIITKTERSQGATKAQSAAKVQKRYKELTKRKPSSPPVAKQIAQASESVANYEDQLAKMRKFLNSSSEPICDPQWFAGMQKKLNFTIEQGATLTVFRKPSGDATLDDLVVLERECLRVQRHENTLQVMALIERTLASEKQVLARLQAL